MDYIFVWSDPDQIKEWRENDETRDRREETVDVINFSQTIAMGFTAVIAKALGAGFQTFYNRADNLQNNLDRVHAVTSALFDHIRSHRKVIPTAIILQ